MHAELGVDAVYAARSSDRPLVDGEGRRPLHFPVGGVARIPAHRGYGASVALPLRPWISAQWIHRKGAQELLAAYRTVGLTLEDFEGPRYKRIDHIKMLLGQQLIDSSLRWRTGVAATS